MQDEYATIAPFYDLEFDEFDADIELYVGYANLVGGPILELGCGTGRVLRHLATFDYQVTGLDSSESMIEIARSRLGSQVETGTIDLMHGDMRDLKELAGSDFRLVIIAVNSFLHLLTQEDQLEALRQIRNLIDRDGLLVIDVFNPTPDVLSRMADRYLFDAEWTRSNGNTVQRFSHRQLDVADQTILTRLFYDHLSESGSLQRHSTSYTMRYVHRFEMELLLRHSGFEIEGFYGSYALDPFEHDSDQIIAVAHRTANPGES
jgi:ubiquinone/menaquinone biosynthesis C-methylase UbiE